MAVRPGQVEGKKGTSKFKKDTFVVIRVPIVITDPKQYGTTQSEFIDAIVDIMGAMVSESGTGILPYTSNAYDRRQVLANRDRIPKRKNHLHGIYVHEIKMRWNNHNSTEAQVHVGHNKPLKNIIKSQIVEETMTKYQALIFKDPLQCGERECVGVLLGLIPVGEEYLNDLRLSILAHPRATALKHIDLTIDLFRTGPVLAKTDPRVRVIHIIADKRTANLTYAILKAIYPSTPRPRSLYPMGDQRRFCKEGGRIVLKRDRSICNNL